jgi:hypothetical protein
MGGYSEALRSIGQALEAKHIISFELKRLADIYTIQNVSQEQVSSKLRRFFWRESQAGITEPLIFKGADVEKLSTAGRAKRTKPDRLTEFKALPSLLRTIGAYLDSRSVELLTLQKRAISVTLSYRDNDGMERKEDRTIASFYRTFLDLCHERSQK